MNSPFASQLGTNYCPTDAEVGRIKGLLVEPCLKLKCLDVEIAAMQKALDKLAEERDALGAYVDAHRILISPLRRLPVDVIEEIFMACLPTHRNCVMSAQEAPVILGRICSSWRTISLSTPSLWSRLHIAEPSFPPTAKHTSAASDLLQMKTVQRLEVANAWLRRSGTCPLSISLESRLNHGFIARFSAARLSAAPPSPDILLPTLISFASRWQTISLRIPPSAIQMLLRLTEADVPLLKSLTINEQLERPHREWNLSQASVLRAPALSRFYVSARNVSTVELPLRWGNLTALTLLWSFAVGPLTCQVVLDILGRCSQLRMCTMLVHGPPTGHLQDSIVECPFLHTLRISSSLSPLQTSGRLLSRLSMPDLQDFELQGYGEPDKDSESDGSLASALAASTRLEFVNIDSVGFLTPSFIELLRSLPPTVRRLHVTEPRRPAVFDDDVFKELEASPDRTTPLPGLEELAVTSCRRASDEMVLRFIISRTPTLRRINIKFDRERQVDILPNLQTFIQGGLQVFFDYKPTRSSLQLSPWGGLFDAPPPTLS
ncbi:hypothetical protein K438DRAFT_1823155 [Mycena galopus ATCC 62051]|nr:hypothetical protein K438DRAFT_1823155 [Mycena galopus ATCC 62051]